MIGHMSRLVVLEYRMLESPTTSASSSHNNCSPGAGIQRAAFRMEAVSVGYDDGVNPVREFAKSATSAASLIYVSKNSRRLQVCLNFQFLATGTAETI